VPMLISKPALPLAPPTGWDGHAAERIVEVLAPGIETGSGSCAAFAAP
jgi:hypothetical protein